MFILLSNSSRLLLAPLILLFSVLFTLFILPTLIVILGNHENNLESNLNPYDHPPVLSCPGKEGKEFLLSISFRQRGQL